MSARPYHKRYHSDALAGFMALTLEERGAYQTFLDLMYDRQGPVLDNERLLAGYMGVSTRRWRALRETLIGKGKIYATDDGHLSNLRAENELENDAKTSRKHAENGSKGGRTKAEAQKNINKNKRASLAGPEHGSTISELELDSVSNETGEAPDPAKHLFDLGVSVLMATGSTEREARSMTGKWRRDYGDGPTAGVLMEVRTKAISNPIEWVPKRLGEQKSSAGYDRNFIRQRYATGA